MDVLQNPTPPTPPTDAKHPVAGSDTGLDWRQDAYLTYVACNGMIVEEGEDLRKMTRQEFADKVGVARDTLYDWQKRIPNFWDLVDKRSREVFNRNRKYKILNGLFLRAAKGDSKQAEMLLSHFGDYVPPTQKHEVRVGGLADLVKIARQKGDHNDPSPTVN